MRRAVLGQVQWSVDEYSEPKFATHAACVRQAASLAPLDQPECLTVRMRNAMSFFQQDGDLCADAVERVSSSRKSCRANASFLGFPRGAKKDLRKTPKLKRNVQIRLLFQSPEIYATDVGDEIPHMGSLHGCKLPDSDGKGESGLIHPEITFNALPPIFGGIREVHVHLEDLTTNQVFWDADFKLPMFDPIVNLVGKTRVKKYSIPKNMADMFHKPCVARDDMRPHFFDLSIRTLGKYWDEVLQEWRPNKGFKGRGPEAHIGFLVQRMPELSFDGKTEQLGLRTKPGSSYAAAGEVIQDPFERVLAGHEDPFYDSMKGKTQRGYYDYIITKGGRTKDRFDYLAKYGPQLLLGVPAAMEDDDDSGNPFGR